MARSTCLAESIYKLKEATRNFVTERGQAIEGLALFDLLKISVFDFQPMLYILILMVLNLRTSERGCREIAESANEVNFIV